MGFALPSGVVNTGTLYIYATDQALGPYVKQPSDQTLVALDYTGVTPAFAITDYSFSIDVTSNPELVVSYPELIPNDSVLLFLMSGGIRGQQYKIAITATSIDATRTDTLVISIPSTGSTDVINPVPMIYSQIPLWGGGYVNTAVRAFWGAIPPSNPNVMDQWVNTVDNTLYEWVSDGTTAKWVVLFSPLYLFDAPHDNVLYGRKNNTWSQVPISEILYDAPGDGLYYARQNHAWSAVPRIPQPSDIPPLMDAPVPVPGVSVDFARIDHIHPTDSTLYSASNPAGYQTAAQVTATLGNYMPLTGGTFVGVVSFGAAALFADPTHIQIGGGNSNYVLSTDGAGDLSWKPPTVGISDAPVDTQTYARNHGAWVNITTATGIPEAPNDGQLWGRESLTWVPIPVGGGSGIPDAPNDSTSYARRNTGGVGAWRHLAHTDITDWSATLAPYALQTSLPVASTTTPLMSGTAAIGASFTYARADHAHPSDTSRYSVTNPANYISEAPNDATSYARKSGGWSHLTHSDITDWAVSTVPVTVSSIAPTTPSVGALWWNTSNQQLYVWSGTAWVITVSPPVIPEPPNDSTVYGRKVTSGVGAWSHLTHYDIADWAATLAAYLPLTGGTLTGGLTAPNLTSIGTASVGSQLNIFGAGGGAGAYVGFYDGPSVRRGYIGNFGATGLYFQSDVGGNSVNVNSNGWIYLNGPTQCSSNLQATYISSSGDIVASGNTSCNVSYANGFSTGGALTAGYIHSTGASQIDGSEQVNGNFNCSNTVSGYSGNFSYSTIYGNLTVNNQIRCVGQRIISQGNSNPSLCAYNTAGYASVFFCDANGTIGLGDADGNGNPSNYRMSIDRGSNVGVGGQVAAGTIYSSGNSFAHGAFYCDNAVGGFFHRDVNGALGMQIYCNTSNNNATWVNNRTGQNLQQDSQGYFIANCNAGGAFKPGGGAWFALSDKRIKDVTGPYKAGLKEVLQLEPVEFTYKGNDATAKDSESLHADLAKDKKKMVGYVADDIMKILPETVLLRHGFIDGEEVDDLKSLDVTNVIHALVNAVKELHAEVQALKEKSV